MTMELPRWSVSDLHESFDSRSFSDAMERTGAEITRLEALYDELGIRAVPPRAVTPDDGQAADRLLAAVNASVSYTHLTLPTILRV